MRTTTKILFTVLIGALIGTVSAQTNLPRGLPSDQILPTRLDGYRLVTIDRTKEIIFDVDGKRVTVEVPLFIYVPEGDKLAESREALKAIHSELARLASQREPVDPERLATLFLALDGILNKPQPVLMSPSDIKPLN